MIDSHLENAVTPERIITALSTISAWRAHDTGLPVSPMLIRLTPIAHQFY